MSLDIVIDFLSLTAQKLYSEKQKHESHLWLRMIQQILYRSVRSKVAET